MLTASSVDTQACTYEYEASTGLDAYHIITPLQTHDSPDTEAAGKETIDFWYGYTGGKVSRQAIKDFFAKTDLARLRSGRVNNRFYTTLRATGKRRALRYIEQCMELNSLQNTYYDDVWAYETPSMDRLSSFARSIAIPASGPLRSRYIFLKMRALSAAHLYKDAAEVWERYGKSLPASALKNRIEGYYGGALYHLGLYPEAVEIFNRNGDVNSLQWCVSKMVGNDSMGRLYESDPNSAALQYVVQDYCNYLKHRRSVIDDYIASGWYDTAAERAEAEADFKRAADDLVKVCDRAMSDPRCTQPMYWASAKGLALQLLGDNGGAIAALDKAATLAGTEQMKKNLRKIRLWASVDGMDSSPEDRSRFLEEFKHAYAEAALDNHNIRVNGNPWGAPVDCDYFTFTLVPALRKHLKESRQTADLVLVDFLMASLDGDWSYMDKGLVKTNLSHRHPMDAIARARAIKRGEAEASDFTKWLATFADENQLTDALGTRLLRSGEFEKALGYLEQVPAEWTARQEFYPWIASRTEADALPFRRAEYPMEPTVKGPARNVKADYCRKVIALKQELAQAPDDRKADVAYRLANLLYQATPAGGLWAASDYTWSSMERRNELNDVAAAIATAALPYATTDRQRGMLQYAIASLVPADRELCSSWVNDRYVYGWHKVRDFTGKQDSAIKALLRYDLADMPAEIRSCDLLKCYLAGTLR